MTKFTNNNKKKHENTKRRKEVLFVVDEDTVSKTVKSKQNIGIM